MRYLGESPEQQPDNLYTFDEYKSFVAQYQSVRDIDMRSILCDEYRSRLPVYLLAKCPFCGGKVTEPVDTFSMNGPGWITASYNPGFGWYGLTNIVPYNQMRTSEDRFKTKPSYTAECEHIRIVAWCVNLNGLIPSDVKQDIQIYSELPFVVYTCIKADGVAMVLSTIPLGRFDDEEMQTRYSIIFMTYFSTGTPIPAGAYVAYRQTGGVDFNLQKWVGAKRVYWMEGTADGMLRNQPIEAFPYNQIKSQLPQPLVGVWIRKGQLEYYKEGLLFKLIVIPILYVLDTLGRLLRFRKNDEVEW